MPDAWLWLGDGDEHVRVKGTVAVKADARTPDTCLKSVATGLFATKRRISGNIEGVSMRSLFIPRLVNFSCRFSPSWPG